MVMTRRIMTSDWGRHPTHSWDEGGQRWGLAGNDDDDNHNRQREEKVDNKPGRKIGNNHHRGNAELCLKHYVIITTCKMHYYYFNNQLFKPPITCRTHPCHPLSSASPFVSCLLQPTLPPLIRCRHRPSSLVCCHCTRNRLSNLPVVDCCFFFIIVIFMSSPLLLNLILQSPPTFSGWLLFCIYFWPLLVAMAGLGARGGNARCHQR